MSNDNSQEKTEEATPKKLEDARKKGQVAHSKDVNTALIMIIAFLYFWIGWEGHVRVFSNLITMPVRLFDLPFEVAVKVGLESSIEFWQKILVPFLAIIILGSLLGAFLVVGPVFSLEPIKVDFTKINPADGFKKLFSMKSLVEVIKSLFVFFLFCIAFYIVMLLSMRYFGNMIFCGFFCFSDTFSIMVLWLIVMLVVILIVVGVIDYMLQNWIYKRDMRMTKDEIKREFKNREGDPVFKQQRRQFGQELVDSKVVPIAKATLVITKGQQLAVVLYYKSGDTPLPVLVAKGSGSATGKILHQARSSGLKIADDATLARQLFDELELGGYLRDAHVQPVAQLMGRLGL